MAETQHDCARPGCTRLTSEQECDLHAAEPAGVIHEPKEPRPVPTREEFRSMLVDHEAWAGKFWHGREELSEPNLAGAADRLLAAYDALAAENAELREIAAIWNAGCGCSAEEHAKLAAERDEWKRRAEEADALNEGLNLALKLAQDDRDRHEAQARTESTRARKAEALAAKKLVDYADLDIRHDALLARADKAEAERDAALKRCDKLEAFIALIESPAPKAWRALDAEERDYSIRRLAITGRLGEVAAAALEALGQGKP